MSKITLFKDFKKSELITMAVVALIITACGIIYKQSVFYIIPLYNSLVVMLLMTQANRYSFLIGALNSILYSVVYFFFRLYSSALYALLFSFPLQMITFIRWKKRAYGSSTVFKRLNLKGWALVVGIFAAGWITLYTLFTNTGSQHIPADVTVTVSGILTTVLTMLSFYDYIYLQLICGFASVILYLQMIPESPQQTTYLVLNLYSFYCMIQATVNVRRLYKEQNKQ